MSHIIFLILGGIIAYVARHRIESTIAHVKAWWVQEKGRW